MAYADYLHCAICDGKTVYDASVNYDYADCADIITLCKNCGETYKIQVIDKSGDVVEIEHADFLIEE